MGNPERKIINFSIIIINYNSYQLSKNCLDSLMKIIDMSDKEIILVDNSSNDDSLEKLKINFSNKVKIITNAKNLGFAKANNQGAEIAQGKWLLFLNNDTIIKEDFLSSAQKILTSNNLIKILSPRLVDQCNKPQKIAFNHFPTITRILLRWSKQELKIPAKTDLLEVDWLSGCALIIERKIFKQIGAWDENFFLYFEDIDLCKRVRNLGYKVAVDLQSEIIHLGGKSIALNRERKKHYYTSQDYYFKKWHSKLELYILKIIRFVFK